MAVKPKPPLCERGFKDLLKVLACLLNDFFLDCVCCLSAEVAAFDELVERARDVCRRPYQTLSLAGHNEVGVEMVGRTCLCSLVEKEPEVFP